jgi:beta-galactosidase GanA
VHSAFAESPAEAVSCPPGNCPRVTRSWHVSNEDSGTCYCSYCLAARPADDAFHDQFAAGLVRGLRLGRNLEADLPEGVTVQKRSGGGRTFLFVHNCTNREQVIDLGATRLRDATDGTVLTGAAPLPPFMSRVVERVSSDRA